MDEYQKISGIPSIEEIEDAITAVHYDCFGTGINNGQLHDKMAKAIYQLILSKRDK